MADDLNKGFYSLESNVNKVKGSQDVETEQGVVSDKFPELVLNMDNDKLGKLTDAWQKTWKESTVYTEWKTKGEMNEKYWKGQHYGASKLKNKDQPMVDNVIFEALETYLPQVIRRNPDPMVILSRKEEQTDENFAFASELQKELGEIADELVFRLKLKKGTRHWALYLLGVFKAGWNVERDRPDFQVIRPQKIILDPEATIDEEKGYTGEFVGEHRKMSAEGMIETLKSLGGESGAEKKVKELAKGRNNEQALGTEIGFIEWWTNDYMCWTLNMEGKNHVLLKKKNPHWNYDTEEEAPYDDNGEPVLDENGQVLKEKVESINFFSAPKSPFMFLTVFNTGKQPMDDTSLIGQNLSNQDLINKRNKQIDKNADSMNGGMVVSGERSGLTKEEGKGVSKALRNGGTIFIPAGSANDAVQRMSAPGLPADIYNQLQDTRIRVRDIFGTRGSSAAGLQSEQTVRGKMQSRMLDTDRIGGGFSEYLEQLADSAYNWFAQLLYVYDKRYTNKKQPKVVISVKEGSLLPKDSLTLANQAIELAGVGKMSSIDLYKALDYPNAEEMAANAWLEFNAPEVLFEKDNRIAQVMQQRQESAGAQQKPPSESMSYKDLPPEGKAQMAAKVGVQLAPEGIAQYEQTQKMFDAKVKLLNK